MTRKPLDMTTSRHRIATNKGRLRIWLDGARLTAAGFTGSTIYWSEARRGSLVLTLGAPPGLTDTRDIGTVWRDVRKVTGRPDGKPIIDMTGQQVLQAFPFGGEVVVTYQPGRIVITQATQET